MLRRQCSCRSLPSLLVLLVGWTVCPRAIVEQAQPTFRSDVELVTLDVIPRTGEGHFVSDLGREDFEVFEEGVRQQVQTLVMVQGGRVFDKVPRAEPAATMPEGIILPSAKSTDAAAGRIFVVLIDDLHFTATDTPIIRAILKKVASTLIHPGDMFAAFSTGPSSIDIPLTYDHARLMDAIGKVAGRGMTYRDIMDAKDGAQGPQGLRYNAHVAFRTINDVLLGLERVRDRRKALLLISTGYDFDPFPRGRTGKDQVFGGRYATPWVDPERGDRFLSLNQAHNRFADADLSSELAAVTGVANRVNASVYSIDPRGTAGTVTVADQVDITEMRTHISKTQGSLRLLAEATGGFAVVDDNDYDGALKRIDAETSDYYIIGYSPTNTDPQRRTRSVEVKVRRQGLELQSRGWYRTRTPPPPPKP